MTPPDGYRDAECCGTCARRVVLERWAEAMPLRATIEEVAEWMAQRPALARQNAD